MQITKIKQEISQQIPWDDDLQQALEIAASAKQKHKSNPRSIDVVLRVLPMTAEKSTLIATLLSDSGLVDEFPINLIKSQFGNQVATLSDGIRKLNTMQDCKDAHLRSPEQAEKLRRLLMAIIADVRVMLIKLCYRLERLKILKHSSYEERRCIAHESLDIYAPLANRLGMGLIKWEIEDLAFRALEPQSFKKIADLLEEKRSEREVFIKEFSADLKKNVTKQGIKVVVSGRVKHIVSIWRKMQRKNLEFHQLFDVRAVRVLVESIADCYAVLGIVHTSWQHIPDEFDDYIANPKENGYRSLHTAVAVEGGKVVEVQIRTVQMHEESEFGVASHWRYKEGINLDQKVEDSISNMRELLESSSEGASDVVSGLSTEIATDRVYVFTPDGQVVDLPKGGTALDFAYAIHSEVGHRCRGAKVNGRIVNLTTALETGSKVEILTAKEGGPSRDWMNRNLGYLKSTGARSKVRNWFNHQDLEQNVLDGKAIYERGLSRYSLHHIDIKLLLSHFKRQEKAQLFADIGRGQITLAQIIGFLQHQDEQDDPLLKFKKAQPKKSTDSGIRIHGVGNLLTNLAKCCKPVPGDEIIGFITVGSGVTIHKCNCSNMLALAEEKRIRLVEVEWGGESESVYPVEITVEAFDRTGLLRDISTLLANEKINLLKISSNSNKKDQMVYSNLTVELHDIEELVTVMDKLMLVSNVQDVKRIA